jgi:diketogulonate reductase-like aldo/keto reductase|tara:strand:- start:20 stop:883 length:864 start_codon:yes stop_codon:yes gene_type:complete
MSKFFTKNNVNIPSIGLGTWDIRGKEGEKIIQLALEVGYRHIDTAQMYENEKEVGNAISDSKIEREEIFITTKIYTLIVKNDGIEDSFENSLINLKTDHVDLLLIHFPAFTTNLNDMLDILFKLKETGKTKNVGISNFNHNLVNECIKLGYKDIFCNQVEYHPYLEQNNLIKVLKEYNILPVAYSPLAKGKLLNDKVVIKIAEKYSKQPAQIILRWLNQQDWISIPKSANEDRMKENMNIFDFTISEKDMNLLHGLARNYRAVPCALGTNHQIDLPSRHGVNGLELI